jgi:hypothetical protein
MKSGQKLRLEIAAIAAKLVAVEGISDYHLAKKKAALQLGIATNRNLPSNQEIEQALIAYQNLFLSDKHVSRLKEFRLQAIQAMKLLADYKPRLVGPVVSGTATTASEIVLHLYLDQVEKLGLFLTEQGIPAGLSERQVKINSKQTSSYPAYRFIAGGTPIVLIIFSEKDKNMKPLSYIDGKPLKSADLNEVMKMLDAADDLAFD